MNVIAFNLHPDSEPAENLGNDAEHFNAAVFDGDLRLCHRCQANEASDLDHVRQQGVLGSAEFAHALDDEEVRSDSADLRTHAVQHEAKLLEVRLTGCVVDGGCAFREHGSHHH